MLPNTPAGVPAEEAPGKMKERAGRQGAGATRKRGRPPAAVQQRRHNGRGAGRDIELTRYTVLDIQVDSLIPSTVRHIIKRYLKRVGLVNVKAKCGPGDSPFSLQLVVTGASPAPLNEEQWVGVRHLAASLDEVRKLAFVTQKRDCEMDPGRLMVLLSKQWHLMNKIHRAVQEGRERAAVRNGGLNNK